MKCFYTIDDFRIILRFFHSSPELLARRSNDDPIGLKTPKRGKFAKRSNTTQPPVEAPYVPPKLKRTSKSSADKTIDIFEGMTIIELAKRSGESVPTLQNILVNVGEKIDSEFDPLGIDIAELVAMVFLLLGCCITPIIVSHVIMMEF